MLATTHCREWDPGDCSVNGDFRSYRTSHSSHKLRDGARPEVVRDILGHADFDVTQNVYSKNKLIPLAPQVALSAI
jgi:hypothetical protein